MEGRSSSGILYKNIYDWASYRLFKYTEGSKGSFSLCVCLYVYMLMYTPVHWCAGGCGGQRTASDLSSLNKTKYVFGVCVHMCALTPRCLLWCLCGGQRTSGSWFSPCGSQPSKSEPQAWWQALLPAGPRSHLIDLFVTLERQRPGGGGACF